MKKGLSLLLSSVMFFCITDCMADVVITCKSAENDSKVKVTITSNYELGHDVPTVGPWEHDVSIVESREHDDLIGNYENLDDVWDGHVAGLMTARGVSIKYESHFGVIKNVTVQAFMARRITSDSRAIRTYHFDECTTNRGYV